VETVVLLLSKGYELRFLEQMQVVGFPGGFGFMVKRLFVRLVEQSCGGERIALREGGIV